ncbi:Arm DNA-binding domain-containing protein [Yoonia sp. MH D7]
MPAIGIRTPAKALTAAYVRSATKTGKHFDGNGLYLFVKPNGAKQWKQRITIRGKRCELGLGSLTVVTLAEAREKALVNRRLVQAGGDPRQVKREAEAMLTFEDAARKVHALNLPTWRNVKHGERWS